MKLKTVQLVRKYCQIKKTFDSLIDRLVNKLVGCKKDSHKYIEVFWIAAFIILYDINKLLCFIITVSHLFWDQF